MEGMLGEVRLCAATFAPQNWALCDGITLPIQENVALFAIIGASFGGDGRSTFALPALPPLQTAVPGGPAIQYMICTKGDFPGRA